MRRWLWCGSPQMRIMQVLIDLTLVVEAISIDMVWKVLIRLMWTKTSWSSTMSAHLLPFSMLASSLNLCATGHCNLHWANINWSNTQYHVNHTKIKYESHPDLQFPGLSHLSMILQTTCLFSFDIQNNNWLNTRILAHMYKLESIHHSHTTPVKDQMWHISFFTYVSYAWQMPMESLTWQQAPNCIAIGIFQQRNCCRHYQHHLHCCGCHCCWKNYHRWQVVVTCVADVISTASVAPCHHMAQLSFCSWLSLNEKSCIAYINWTPVHGTAEYQLTFSC